MTLTITILLMAYLLGAYFLSKYLPLERENKEDLKGLGLFFGMIICFLIVTRQFDALGVGLWMSAIATLVLFLLAFGVVRYVIK